MRHMSVLVPVGGISQEKYLRRADKLVRTFSLQNINFVHHVGNRWMQEQNFALIAGVKWKYKDKTHIMNRVEEYFR